MTTEAGELVRQRLLRKGVRPRELRAATGVSSSMASLMLSKGRGISTWHLDAIADLLGVSVPELFQPIDDGTDPAPASPSIGGGVDAKARDSARVLAEKDLELFDALSEAAATIVRITGELFARHGAQAIPRRQITAARADKSVAPHRARKRRG